MAHDVLAILRGLPASATANRAIAGQYATTGRARCRRCGEDIQKLNPVGGFIKLSRGHAHKHNSVVSRREWITVGPKTVLNHRRTEDYSLQVVIF